MRHVSRIAPRMTRYKLRTTNTGFNELLRHATAFRNEAERCRRARAYYAGLAMLATALEGSLLAMCIMYPAEAAAAANSLKRSPKGHILKWDFATLILIAKRARWLPARSVGNAVDSLRRARNALHIGRHVRDWPIDFRAADYKDADKVVDIALEWLVARVTRDW
jgi:hypothetical protein